LQLLAVDRQYCGGVDPLFDPNRPYGDLRVGGRQRCETRSLPLCLLAPGSALGERASKVSNDLLRIG
jgi:hypothetical protein